MTYLLDTSALLLHFRQETGAEQVQQLFDDDDAVLLVASLSLPEMARRLRDLGSSPSDARRVVADYQGTFAEVVPVDATIALLSFDLSVRMPERLPLVDALIAAAAFSRQACLVHRDKHLRTIPATILPQLDLGSPSP